MNARNVLTAALLLLPTLCAAQTVTDSVRVTRLVYYYQNQTDIFSSCGAGIYAVWPDVASRILEREVGYSFYRLVATEGYHVPGGFGQQLSDPAANIVVPGGYLGHNPQLLAASSGTGGFNGCGDHLTNVNLTNSGAEVMLNGRPWRATDWYAIYSLPSGTPIAEFVWESEEFRMVAFDASFESELSREVEITGKKPVVKYEWDFGDGNTGSGAKPVHQYEKGGTYLVTLTVTDDDDEQDSVSYSVRISDVRLVYTVTVDTTDLTLGDELDVVGRIKNVGTETATDVMFSREPAFIPVWAEEHNVFFKNNALRGPAQFASTDTTVAQLEAGEEVEFEQTYEITRTASSLLDGTWLDVPVQWHTTLVNVSGSDPLGQPADVLDGCKRIVCQDTVTIVPPEAGMRYEIELDRYAADAAGKVGDDDPIIAVGDTFLVRLRVFNKGDLKLENIKLPDGDDAIEILSEPPGAAAFALEVNPLLTSLEPGEEGFLEFAYEAKFAITGGKVYVGKVQADAVGVNGVRRAVEELVTTCEVNQKRANDDDDPSEGCADLDILGGVTVNSVGDAPLNSSDDVCDTGDTILRDGDEEPECTLRAAIQLTNRQQDTDLIGFDIPAGAGKNEYRIIRVGEPLSTVKSSVRIDGGTQPGHVDGSPRIAVVAGGGASDGVGLELAADSAAVANLVISGFGEAGVKVGAVANVVTGNIIGRTSGGAASGQSGVGVLLEGASKATVSFNFVSGNSDAGVLLTEGSSENTIGGNWIGPTPERTEHLANGHGVKIEGSPSNDVSGNRIHGNNEVGVYIVGAEATGNALYENHIGQVSDDTEGNKHGVVIESASNNMLGPASKAADVNVVSGNRITNILIFSEDEQAPANGNVVDKTWVGSDTEGSSKIDNDGIGIAISGWASQNEIGAPNASLTDVSVTQHGTSGRPDIAIYGGIGPTAVGNKVWSGLIGFSVKEFEGKESVRHVRRSFVNIQVVGAAETQIGNPGATEKTVIVGNASEAAIDIAGTMGRYRVDLDGRHQDPDYDLSLRVRGATVSNVDVVSGEGADGLVLVTDRDGINLLRVDDFQVGPGVTVSVCHKLFPDPETALSLFDANDGLVVGSTFRGCSLVRTGRTQFESLGIVLRSSSRNRIGLSTREAPPNLLHTLGTAVLIHGGASNTSSEIDPSEFSTDNSIVGNTFGLPGATPSNLIGVHVSYSTSGTRIGGPDAAHGNTFASSDEGVVVREGSHTFFDYAGPILNTTIENNRFGTESVFRAGRVAIHAREAVNTRIGSLPLGAERGNTIRGYDLGVWAADDSEGPGTAILGNSMEMTGGKPFADDRIYHGIATNETPLTLENPFPTPPLTGVVTLGAGGGAEVRALGYVWAEPDKAILLQFFRSSVCEGVDEGRDLLLSQSVTTNALGLAVFQTPVEISSVDGLTVTATNIDDHRTGPFSSCFMIGDETGKVELPAGSDPSLHESLDLIFKDSGFGKGGGTAGADSDTLFVTSYDAPPEGLRFTGEAAVSASGSVIMPQSVGSRYWRVETLPPFDDRAYDVCLGVSEFSGEEASELVVLQRNRNTGGRWAPRSTQLETHSGNAFACATGVDPFGDFVMGSGEPAAVARPELELPANQSEVADLIPVLSWMPVPGTSEYQVQMSSIRGFGHLEMNVSGVLETMLETNLSSPFIPYYWRVRALAGNGEWGPWSETWSFTPTNVAVAVEDVADVPEDFALMPNYPNPFNPQTTIPFSVARSGHVLMSVYNVAGHEVARLVDRSLSPGRYEAVFDARDLPSGMYLYRMSAGATVLTGRMMLVK